MDRVHGFTNALSLYKVADNGTHTELTYEIATQGLITSYLDILTSHPNIETFWLLVSLILHQDAN